MTMRFRVSHTTSYVYGDPVSLCHNITHLKPRDTDHQTCLSSQVRVSPWPSVSREHRDIFGNRVNYFSIQLSHARLEVTAVSELTVNAPPPPDEAASPPWERVRDRLQQSRHPETLEARIFSLPSTEIPAHPAALDYALQFFAPGRPVLSAARELMASIYTEFEYDPTATSVATPLATVLEQRRGVCQDFAHAGIACLRSLGLAARYVSGYLETLPPPGQPKLRGADASHAWYALYLPPETDLYAPEMGVRDNQPGGPDGPCGCRRSAHGLLGGLRPHQRLPVGGTAHHDRRGPRLPRRHAGPRHLLWRRRSPAQRRRGRGSHAVGRSPENNRRSRRSPLSQPQPMHKP
jgi:transglutaminase-like putative cysteine protease